MAVANVGLPVDLAARLGAGFALAFLAVVGWLALATDFFGVAALGVGVLRETGASSCNKARRCCAAWRD